MACKRSRLAHNTWVATESADEAADNLVHSNALFKYVVEKYVSGRFTADEVCMLANLIGAAKGSGLQRFDIGADRGNVLNHAGRKVREVIADNFEMPGLFYCKVPMNEKRTSIRSPVRVPVRLPREAILQDYDPASHTNCTFASEIEAYPMFERHPVVLEALAEGLSVAEVIPVALYWDGIVYTKNDSVICYYAQNMRTRCKYLLALARPQQLIVVLTFNRTSVAGCTVKRKARRRLGIPFIGYGRGPA